jgi:hypothetical protein
MRIRSGNLFDPWIRDPGWKLLPIDIGYICRRHGWKKLYIVVSSRKIIFFNSEVDRQNSDPSLILDLSKVVSLVSYYAFAVPDCLIPCHISFPPNLFLYANSNCSRACPRSNSRQVVKTCSFGFFSVLNIRTFMHIIAMCVP